MGRGLPVSGLDPTRLVLVETRDAAESLWAMEEALKCRSHGFGDRRNLGPCQKSMISPPRAGSSWRRAKAARRASSSRRVSQAKPIISQAAPRRGLKSGRAPAGLLPSAGGRLPLPGKTLWAVRLVKARAGPHGFGFDRDKVHSLTWDPEKACFCDALSFALSSLSGDGPAQSAGSLSTPGSAARDFHQDQIGAAARLRRSIALWRSALSRVSRSLMRGQGSLRF